MSTDVEREAAETTNAESKPPFLRRVRIRGYKSIAFCDVTLEPLTILVGRNASGKSNFLDALAFVRDAMATNITDAAKRHGGWQSMLCRMSPDGQITIETEVTQAQQRATYGFTLREGPSASPVLIHEWFRTEENGDNPSFDLSGKYDPTSKTVGYEWNFHHPSVACSQVPQPRPDRLWLGSFGNQPFIDISDGLRFSGYYNFNPEIMRRPQIHAAGELLERDGRNLASVIETTREIEAWAVERAGRYLRSITKTTGFAGVDQSGGYETLRFRVAHNGQAEPLEFSASSMSDGTLRAFAALVAAFQMALPHGYPSLVAIEEPETALHPAAMRALVAAMDEATLRTQILLTTHSPDLLDAAEVKPANVRVVQMIDGQTVIGPVDEAGVEIVTRNLSTLGGLERENQLEPDLDDQDRQRELAGARQGDRP